MISPIRSPRRPALWLGLGLLVCLLLGAGLSAVQARPLAIPTGTPTPTPNSTATSVSQTSTAVSLTATAIFTSTTATAVAGTATAVAGTATAVSLTATAVAYQGTVTTIQQTQTAVAATLTALAAASPTASSSPRPTGTPTPTPIPCQDAYDPAGEPTAARPITIGENQLHIFCPAGETDWVTFFGKAGKAYRLETSELAQGVDTYFSLFATDGRTLLASNDDAPGRHGPSLLVFTPQADGWYFLQVKDQGDIGFPGAFYTLTLSLTDLPTATPAPATATAPAAATPTSQPIPTQAPLPLFTPTPPAGQRTPPPAGQPTATPNGLLHPQGGGAGSGGLPVFDAGPPDGMQPDSLEPDDSFETAHALNVGAVYQHLNFVPSQPWIAADVDYYGFKAKPGNCYAVSTGDLTAGLDTTILLWQSAPTREGRRLLAQNDDLHPHTPDLSSAVRWCNPLTAPDDLWLVAEIRNYGGNPPTDPHGKTYSLVLQIDPPTPTPTRTPRPDPPAGSAGGGGGGGSGGGAISNVGGPPIFPAGPPTRATVYVAPTPVPPAPAAPTPQPTISHATAVPPATSTSLPTLTPLPTAPPTAAPPITADVVVYTADQAASAPNAPQPSDGVSGITVVLADAYTNAPLQTTRTDTNGHAQLVWAWAGPVKLTLPGLGWTHRIDTAPPTPPPGEQSGGLHIYFEAWIASYPLPGVIP